MWIGRIGVVRAMRELGEDMEKGYTEINSKTIDKWCEDGWEWSKPITHE